MDITEVTRRGILDYLLVRDAFFTGRLELVEFLGRIWDVHTEPSDGTKSMEHYLYKGYVYGDWTPHYLLYDYLDLLHCEDEMFLKFLEECIHPVVQPDKEEVNALLIVFNEVLVHDGYLLKQAFNLSGKPVYKAARIKGGVQGNVKNLIFAANGPKPDLVLIDSVSNDIKIARNEEYCLVYDKPVLERGVLWIDLIEWWRERQGLVFSDQRDIEVDLYQRLQSALPKSSPPEKLLFRTYFAHFRNVLGDNLPALVPQVYLHYDPKTISQLAEGQRLIRQRMDFLLLFSNHIRVVLEVDGQQHYSVNGTAKPELYAMMVAEDRRLRLSGYEIYRFGGHELQGDQGKAVVIEFFNKLFNQYSVKK